MSNLKKGAQLILLFTVNFFNAGVFADQFTEDCGRIIDINDYKRCTRKQFTISYEPDPATTEALLEEPKSNAQTNQEPEEDLKIVVDEPNQEPEEDLKIAVNEINQDINTQINLNMTINLDRESVSAVQLDEIVDDSNFKKALKLSLIHI